MEKLCPEIVVESKGNNSELLKAVRGLKNTDNRYIIIFDNSFDNLQVVMERKLLKNYIETKDNVVLMDIICFEYILLQFQDVLTWIYAPKDEFREKRKSAITARKKLIKLIEQGEMNYKDIKEIVEYDIHVEKHNIEQLISKLLFDLTRNTGFEVSKGKIGECWIKSCCEWKERMTDDICGLDYNRLSAYDKMKNIYEKTCLKEQFQAVRLEVVL